MFSTLHSVLLLFVLIVMYSSSANSTQNPSTLREERVRGILLRRQQRQERQDAETRTVPQPVLLIEGARFPAFDFVRPEDDVVSNRSLGDVFTIAGRPIYLTEKAEDVRRELESEEHTVRTAGSIWDCGIILAKYLEKQVVSLALKDRRVIELGAGKSLPGLAAAVLGARVTLTDAPGVVPSIRRIVALNGLDAPSRGSSEGMVEMVEALDWVDRDLYLSTILPAYAPPFDLIICSDVVWVEYLIEPLVATLAVLAPTSATQVLLAHQTRSTRADARLFAELERAGFVCESVPGRELAREGGFWKETVEVFRVRKRTNV